MDLRMPVMDGVEATQIGLCSARMPAGTDKPKIIALTTFTRDQAVVQAVQAGASGYLLKSAEPEFLLAAIRTVHSGYSVTIAPGSIHSLFEHAARSAPATGPDLSVLNVLSARERDVFLLAAKGLSNGEMAEKLCSFPKQPSKPTCAACWTSWSSEPGCSWSPSPTNAVYWAPEGAIRPGET